MQLAGMVTFLEPGSGERRHGSVDVAYVVSERVVWAKWFADYLGSWSEIEVSIEVLVNGVRDELTSCLGCDVSTSASCEVAGISVTTFAGG